MKRNAEYYITNLQLQPHVEGGYFREAYRSNDVLKNEMLSDKYSGDRNMSTSIYFLLKADQFSTFHRLKSDEIWHFYDGDAIALYMIDEKGALEKNTIGRNILEGEVLQLTIPAGRWFAAHVIEEGAYGLVGCTVAPGFDFNDFELADKANMLHTYPQHASLINKIM